MPDNPFLTIDEELKAQQIEFKIHCAVVKQIPIWFPFIKFIHIPNRPGDAVDGHFKKMMGAMPGAADFLLGWKMPINAGAGFLEIKAPYAKTTTNQNHFLSAWASIGFHTGVAKSCREAHTIICGWGIKPASQAIWEPDLRSDMQKKADAFNLFGRP